MNIGIDFDGVILDTERWLKFYADYYSYFELNKKIRNYENFVEQEKCFDWTEDEKRIFYTKYYVLASKNAPFIAGSIEIIKKLKQEGHKIYLISARSEKKKNKYNDNIALAKSRLSKIDLEFDGYSWGSPNKCEVCKLLGLDIMVEDNPTHVKTFIGSDINVLFFKDVKISNITGENIKKIDTWMDIYLEIKKLENIKK